MDSLTTIIHSNPGGSLPKSNSNVSLSSSTTPSVSSTLNKDFGQPEKYSSELTFVGCTLSNSLDIAAALGNRSPESIEYLRINCCRMDGKTFSNVVASMSGFQLPNVHTVDLAQNQLCGLVSGMALADLLKHLPAVRTLSLGWNKLSIFDLKPMSDRLVYNIKCLDLRANPLCASTNRSKHRHIQDTDYTWIKTLFNTMPNLTHVLMAQVTINNVEALASLLTSVLRPNAAIEYVGLEWLSLGSHLSVLQSIMKHLASPELGTLAKSLHINLSSNNLGDSGIKTITDCGVMLQSLTLACNFVTQRGAEYLSKWLPQSGLEKLDLSDNYFGDQGVISLLDRRPDTYPQPRYCPLKELNLASCCLSDNSIRYISNALLENWAPLETLVISKNSRISSSARLSL